MSVNISKIRKYLARKGSADLHRQVIVLAGSSVWQKKFLSEVLSGYEIDSLWVTDEQEKADVPDLIPVVDTRKCNSWLGKEKQIVIFDANNYFHPDSFAAISGIVIGGGIFFLLMPSEDEWGKVYPLPFGKRFINSVKNNSEILVIIENDEDVEIILKSEPIRTEKNFITPFLSSQQQHVVEQIEAQVLNTKGNPVVITSDRGRGKSAALGLASAKLLKKGIRRIVVTAPSMRATDIIFKHIADSLSEADVQRGCVKISEGKVRFYPPDELLQEDIDADLLLIDEAAAIPVPMLSMLLEKYEHCVFSTTIHGYEGTGRGFAVRFKNALDRYKPGWIKLEMKKPVRWAEDDPLEKWMFKLFCLDAEIVDMEQELKFDTKDIEHLILNKDKFQDDEILLNEIFGLLVVAHYRTRPGDLMDILDNNKLSLYVARYKNNIIAVALVSKEGNFEYKLSSEVYQGKRRPKGHLLAQALTYHCGIEHAATLDYARIMRIAVHPQLMLRGIGSRFLKFIIDSEKSNGRDAIGSSFGMNKGLLSFWDKAGLSIVRIGFTREKTSGEHAAIMLKPLNEKGKGICDIAHDKFSDNLQFWLEDVLSDLPLNIKEKLTNIRIDNKELEQLNREDIESYISHSRNYELCIAAINKLFYKNHGEICNENFPGDFREVLVKKIKMNRSWNDISDEMDVSGKNAARELFYKAICYLIKQSH